MIVALPVATPVTTPVPEPTVAIKGSLLIHEPPAVASLNVIACPSHTFGPPVIVAGNGLTVVMAVVIQPVGSV